MIRLILCDLHVHTYNTHMHIPTPPLYFYVLCQLFHVLYRQSVCTRGDVCVIFLTVPAPPPSNIKMLSRISSGRLEYLIRAINGHCGSTVEIPLKPLHPPWLYHLVEEQLKNCICLFPMRLYDHKGVEPSFIVHPIKYRGSFLRKTAFTTGAVRI